MRASYPSPFGMTTVAFGTTTRPFFSKTPDAAPTGATVRAALSTLAVAEGSKDVAELTVGALGFSIKARSKSSFAQTATLDAAVNVKTAATVKRVFRSNLVFIFVVLSRRLSFISFILNAYLQRFNGCFRSLYSNQKKTVFCRNATNSLKQTYPSGRLPQ